MTRIGTFRQRSLQGTVREHRRVRVGADRLPVAVIPEIDQARQKYPGAPGAFQLHRRVIDHGISFDLHEPVRLDKT